MGKEHDLLAKVAQGLKEYKDLIKKHEAAERLRVSMRTVDRMAEKGQLTKYKVWNGVGFSEHEVNHALFTRKPEPKKPQPIHTTFSKFTTNKKAAPEFPPHFGKTIEVTLPDNQVILSAQGCYDPQNPTGEVLHYNWEVLKGSNHQQGMLRKTNESSTEFVSLVLGEYKLRLTLTGFTGVTASKEFIVRVNMKPRPKPTDPAAEPDPGVSTGPFGSGSPKGSNKNNFSKLFFPVKFK